MQSCACTCGQSNNCHLYLSKHVIYSSAARQVLTTGFACRGALLAGDNKSPCMRLAAGSGAWKGLLDGFDGRV